MHFKNAKKLSTKLTNEFDRTNKDIPGMKKRQHCRFSY